MFHGEFLPRRGFFFWFLISLFSLTGGDRFRFHGVVFLQVGVVLLLHGEYLLRTRLFVYVLLCLTGRNRLRFRGAVSSL